MYETIIIPKGTVLFRSTNTTYDFIKDFAGLPKGDDEFCLFPNFNVFFYPYPFVSESVSKYNYTSIFILRRDIKLIHLISPSKFTRRDRLEKKGGIVSCDKVDFKECTDGGNDYDPCIDFDVVKDNEIVGMIAIAQEDAKSLRRLLLTLDDENENKKQYHATYYNKYYKLYKDARNIIGVPEIILYPRKYIYHKNYSETIRDFPGWMLDNYNEFNYTIFHTVKGNKKLQIIMDQLMSKTGFNLDGDIYNMYLNKETGFFQMSGFTEPYIKVDKNNDLSTSHDEFKFVSSDLEELKTRDEAEVFMKIQEWIALNDTNATLKLDNYNLKTIPNDLPPNLKELWIDNNKIEVIENLPESLISLNVAYNNIKKIPNLPKNLKFLYIDYNKVENIDNLPNSIVHLYITNNKNIKRIHKLPESLTMLFANNCSIEYIKSFPKNLQYIYLNDNNLESIPNLPNNVVRLNVQENPIQTLPTIPPSMKELLYDEPGVVGINDI